MMKNDPQKCHQPIVLTRASHHVRAQTLHERPFTKNKITDAIKSLLKERGVAPKKLFRPNNNFGELSLNVIKRNPALQSKKIDSIINDTTSISVSKANRCVTMKRSRHAIIQQNLYKQCAILDKLVSIENTNKMIYNIPTHIVAIFKDYLIYDDANEFLNRFYQLKEFRTRLYRIAEYYCTKGKIHPSFAALTVQRVLKKGKERKEKILRIKFSDEIGKYYDGSMLFDTLFMNSLAREDLQNSRSYLPSDSLAEITNHDGGDRIVELLDKLSEVVSTKNAPPEEKSVHARNVLNLYASGQKRFPVAPQDEVKTIKTNLVINELGQPRKKRAKAIVGSIKLERTIENSISERKDLPGRNLRRMQSLRNEIRDKANATGRNLQSNRTESSSNPPRIKVNLTSAGTNTNTTATIILNNCKVALNSYLTTHTRAPSFSSNPIGNMKGAKGLRRIICQTHRREHSQEVTRKPAELSERTAKARSKSRIKRHIGLTNFNMKPLSKI